tara:strand:+ start:1336 stop:1578 length:243 start_codon:yes stop_codon:yes gene_type:complete
MTIKEIIIEALHDPQNWTSEGEVNWNFVDSDLWLHPYSKVFTDKEKIEGLDNFPDELIPMTELINGVHTPVNARVTHPLP